MTFDPRVAEIYTTRYGAIKFYTNSIFQVYLEHLDNLIKESLLPRQTQNDNLQKLLERRWLKSESALGSAGIPNKKKRGRPKGSKSKKKPEVTLKKENILQKAEKHIVEREPFETTKEFMKRKKEELSH